VASYGHPDGTSICVNGKDLAALETERYVAETMAIADAQLHIDSLTARRLS
jgi:hypothetical protein